MRGDSKLKFSKKVAQYSVKSFIWGDFLYFLHFLVLQALRPAVRSVEFWVVVGTSWGRYSRLDLDSSSDNMENLDSSSHSPRRQVPGILCVSKSGSSVRFLPIHAIVCPQSSGLSASTCEVDLFEVWGSARGCGSFWVLSLLCKNRGPGSSAG